MKISSRGMKYFWRTGWNGCSRNSGKRKIRLKMDVHLHHIWLPKTLVMRILARNIAICSSFWMIWNALLSKRIIITWKESSKLKVSIFLNLKVCHKLMNYQGKLLKWWTKEKEIPRIIDFTSMAKKSCAKFKTIRNRIQEMMSLWLRQIVANVMTLNKDVQNSNFINCTTKNLLT